MSDIQPGDVVVCVQGNCGAHGDDLPTRLVVVGHHYTVERIFWGPQPGWDGCIGGVRLCGVPDGPLESFCIAKFRKLNDEPDNIEIVERIKACKPINSPVSA